MSLTNIIEERWVYGSALHVENPAVGRFSVLGTMTTIELGTNQHNWLICSIPAPNVLDGWKVRAVMIRYNIRRPDSRGLGIIDKIGIRNGNLDVARFEGLTIGPNSIEPQENWEVRKLVLPRPGDFKFGLGVTIHVLFPQISPIPPPTKFSFTSIGLEFIKSIPRPPDPTGIDIYRIANPVFGNKLLVADERNHRILNLNNLIPGPVEAWGSEGSGIGQFRFPKAVAIDPNTGNIFVADTNNNRIQKFTLTGVPITQWGSLGTGDDQFNLPWAIALDPSTGDVYVSDRDNNRIQKFTNDGNFITKLDNVTSLGIAVGPDGNLYVSSQLNKIQKFASDGQFIKEWGSSGTDDGEFDTPVGITVDSNNEVYVVDNENHRVQKFTSNGDFITKWGTFGSGNGQFRGPYGIAFDRDTKGVYVSDHGIGNIQIFTQDGQFLKFVSLSPIVQP
jgi:DNA-binding beta-propeller fold protein YncE